MIFFVDALGTGMYLAGAVAFFVQGMRLPPSQVGIGLSAGAAVGLVTTFPIGVIADRLGPRRTLVGICAWRAVGFAGYALVHGFAAFLTVSCLLGVAAKAMSPVMQALVDVVTGPEERVRAMAAGQALRNVGFGLGGLIAIAPLEIASRGAYDTIVLGNAISFIVAGVCVLLLSPVVPLDRRIARRQPLGVLRDRRYLALTALNGVVMLNQTMLTVGIPLWALRRTSVPHGLIPVFLVLNTGLAALGQVPAARLAVTVQAARRICVGAGALAAASAICVAATGGMAALPAAVCLLAAVVLQTAGELLNASASWQLSFSFAPAQSRGAYLAAFGLGAAIDSALGPYVFTAGAFILGAPGWLVLAACFAAAGTAIYPVANPRHAVEAQPHAESRSDRRSNDASGSPASASTERQ